MRHMDVALGGGENFWYKNSRTNQKLQDVIFVRYIFERRDFQIRRVRVIFASQCIVE